MNDISKRFKKPKDMKNNLRVCLYGPAGSGKTTIAASFPKPLLLIDIKEKTENVLLDIKGIDILSAKTPKDVEDVYWYLHDNPKKYKTVVIDTITKFQDLILDEILEKRNKTSKDSLWGGLRKQDWGTVSNEMKTLVMNFCDLSGNVVFLAQDRENVVEQEPMDDVNGEVLSFAEIGPACIPSVAKMLNASVEILGNTFIMEETEKKKKKIKGKLTIVKEKKINYCLRVGPHAVYRSKIRKPKSIEIKGFLTDPDYEQLAQIIGR